MHHMQHLYFLYQMFHKFRSVSEAALQEPLHYDMCKIETYYCNPAKVQFQQRFAAWNQTDVSKNEAKRFFTFSNETIEFSRVQG